MIDLTFAQLHAILPYSRQRAREFLPHLNAAMAANGITTPARACAFIAQLGHESGSFLYVKELASGRAYEGRADLGNTQKGDGVRFKGRGLIQVTGRDNYIACSLALFGDRRLLEHPELLEEPKHAVDSAAWFWRTHGLNAHADKFDMHRITKIINGGYNGLAERLAMYRDARKVLMDEGVK